MPRPDQEGVRTLELHQDSHFFVHRGSFRYTAYVNEDFTGDVTLVKTEHAGNLPLGEHRASPDRQNFDIPISALVKLLAEMVRDRAIKRLKAESPLVLLGLTR